MDEKDYYYGMKSHENNKLSSRADHAAKRKSWNTTMIFPDRGTLTQ